MVLAIAGTIAYNEDSMFFANLFKLGDGVTEFVEAFESLDNWSPPILSLYRLFWTL